jgi:predicted transcriptional regulator
MNDLEQLGLAIADTLGRAIAPAAEAAVRRVLAEREPAEAGRDRWLSAASVADLLDVSAPTARALMREAGIKPIKLGNVLRYSAAAVTDYLAREAAEQNQVRLSKRGGGIRYLIEPERLPDGAVAARRR